MIYDGRTSTVERALQLARSGLCDSIEHIRNRLRTEQFPSVDAYLGSDTFKKQLNLLMKDRSDVQPPAEVESS